MPNSSGTWKTGEKAAENAQFQCLDCRERGTVTHVTLKQGEIFPYCTVCDIKDNTWKFVGPPR